MRKSKRRRLELPFLASSVPNLSLDNLGIDIQGASGELNANGGLRLEVELVLGEPRQQIRLPNSGVSDQHNLKQVVVVIVTSVTRHSKLLLLLQLAANILLFLLFIYLWVFRLISSIVQKWNNRPLLSSATATATQFQIYLYLYIWEFYSSFSFPLSVMERWCVQYSVCVVGSVKVLKKKKSSIYHPALFMLSLFNKYKYKCLWNI